MVKQTFVLPTVCDMAFRWMAEKTFKDASGVTPNLTLRVHQFTGTEADPSN